MTADWRKIEDELTVAFEAAGLNIARESGDVYTVLASIPDCHRPSTCGAGVGPYGKMECADCENEANLNGHMSTLSITGLAKRLALIIGGQL